MISEAELFAGTPISETVRHGVYQDIAETIRRHGGLAAYNARTSAGPQVLIQGSIIVHEPSYNHECMLPVSISLPPNFPNSPPICQIVTNNAYMCNPSQVFAYDGNVQSQYVVAWRPYNTTICDFVGYLCGAVERWMPVPPHILNSLVVNKRELVEAGVREATEIVEDYNRRLYERSIADTDQKRNALYASMVHELRGKLEGRVSDSQKRVASASEVQECQIDESDAAKVREEARERAFTDTVAGLRQAFQSSSITLGEMIKAIRDLGRTHFEKSVYPRMSR